MAQQFKVLSDKCSLGKKGATVTIDEKSGLNVDALVQGGHIAPVAAKPTPKESEKEEI
jgi:hypothetical protein